MALVSDGLQMECSSEKEREQFGERLKVAIRSFTVDFLPHMNEEEEEEREGGGVVVVCIGSTCVCIANHRLTTPENSSFFFSEKKWLPQAGLKPITSCIPCKCSTS